MDDEQDMGQESGQDVAEAEGEQNAEQAPEQEQEAPVGPEVQLECGLAGQACAGPLTGRTTFCLRRGPDGEYIRCPHLLGGLAKMPEVCVVLNFVTDDPLMVRRGFITSLDSMFLQIDDANAHLPKYANLRGRQVRITIEDIGPAQVGQPGGL